VQSRGLREPVQKRSQAALDRMLKVGAQLLQEQGYAGFTIAELVRRAKVSPGLFYGRFESKDSLFYAIQARELDRIGREFEELTAPERWEQQTLGELLEGLVTETAAFIEHHAPLFDVFVARGAVDDVVQQRSAAFISMFNTRVRDLLLTRREEITRPDPERAATVSCQLISSVFVRLGNVGGVPPEQSLELPWAELIDELPTVCCTYLTN